MKSSAPLHFTLIAAAALSAFSLRPAAQGPRAQLAKLFEPVAAPTRAIAQWGRARISTDKPVDLLSPGKDRSRDELLRQNGVLITQVQNLQAQLEDLKRYSAAARELGTNLQQLVEPARITAWPTANRQTLMISTSGLSNVRNNLAVVHPFGFAGTIQSTATIGGAAQVLLVTDPESSVQARFASFVVGADGRITTTMLPIEPIVARGDGSKIVATMVAAQPVRQHLKVGDIVLLDDGRFGPALKGLRVGKVSKIDVPQTNAKFASIEIEPTADFAHLSEVLVVTK